MNHYARLKRIEQKRLPKLPVFDREVMNEVDSMVSEALRDAQPLPENRLEELQTVTEIEAEIERIVFGGDQS